MSLREKLESWFHKDVVEVLVGLEERVQELEHQVSLKSAVPLPPEMPALAAAVPPPKVDSQVDVPLPAAGEDHDNP
jgi:hypothetical protein